MELTSTQQHVLQEMRRRGMDWIAQATERHWRAGETYYIDSRVNAQGIRRMFNKCNREAEKAARTATRCGK